MIIGIDARVPLARGRGWGRYACEIIEALAATRKVDLRILLPEGPLASALAERLPARNDVRIAFAPFTPETPAQFWQAAAGVKPETVFGRVDLLHSPTRFILPTDLRPLAATVHDVAPLSKPAFKSSYRDATLRAIEFIRDQRVHVMAVSEFTRRELRDCAGLDVKNVVVVHHGVSPVFLEGKDDNLPEEHGLPRGCRYVLYVGGSGANKNLTRLMAAFRLVRKQHEVDLVLAGDRVWDYADLQKALGAYPPSWVRVTGYVSDQELARLYRRSAACVLPSLHEGFGLPALEAMACGTPLACSRIAPLEEVVQDAGVYFDPRDVDAIAAAVASLLDARAVADLVAAGRARARTFTWGEAARKTIEVYRMALDGGSPGAS